MQSISQRNKSLHALPTHGLYKAIGQKSTLVVSRIPVHPVCFGFLKGILKDPFLCSLLYVKGLFFSFFFSLASPTCLSCVFPESLTTNFHLLCVAGCPGSFQIKLSSKPIQDELHAGDPFILFSAVLNLPISIYEQFRK